MILCSFRQALVFVLFFIVFQLGFSAAASARSLASLTKVDGQKMAQAMLVNVTSHYSASEKVESLIDEAMRRTRRRPRGLCYRHVKKALKSAGLVDRYLGGRSARQAGYELKRQGFINILENNVWRKVVTSPYDAPAGAILVYVGGRHGHGHIEIRAKDGFVSDYFGQQAITGSPENGWRGRGRRLIGVYIKAPDLI